MNVLKWIFDRSVALVGLLMLWPLLVIIALMVKVKMPGGPAFFVQNRVGKNGKLFKCHKFRTMLVRPVVPEVLDGTNVSGGWSSVSVAGDSRITPFGALLRHYKLDELPGLWDVLIGNMSFVGPRPDVPGYADKLEGEDRDVLKLRPGITGPATLKYRSEDEMIAVFVESCRLQVSGSFDKSSAACKFQGVDLPLNYMEMSDQELAVWYNDSIIYPDKVRLNCYYYRHYSFIKDVEMIFATVLGLKVKYAGELL